MLYLSMRRWAIFLGFACLLSSAGVAAAQEKGKEPTPEEMQQMMQATMLPMMGDMMAVMMESMAKTLARPEIAEQFATYTKNYYEALLKRGFSKEEALRIVTATGIPSVQSQQ